MRHALPLLVTLLVGLACCSRVRPSSAREEADVQSDRICAEVDALRRHVEDRCRDLAERCAQPHLDPDALRRLQHEALRADTLLQGAVAGFEPGFPTDSVRACADYFFRSGPRIEHLDLTTIPVSYRTWPWYRRAEGQTSPVWTEPYIDEGGGGVAVITCVLPIRSLRNGAVIGVQAVDVAVHQFERILRQAKGVEAWIMTERGSLLATTARRVTDEPLPLDTTEARPHLVRSIGASTWTLRVRY